MSAPSYTTDLIILASADGGAEDFDEATAAGWISLFAMEPEETEYFIQGEACVSWTVKTGVGACLFNNAAGVTIPTDGAFLVWQWWGAPNSLATEANGGIRLVCGSDRGNFYGWILGGSDTYAYGGWQCLAAGDPSVVTPDYTVGSPTATRQYFGWGYNAPTSVPGKGNPYAIDALRYGRCKAIFENGSPGDGYATFAGFAAINDGQYNRWGLVQAISGGYLWQGLMSIGTAATSVNFNDENTNITIADTKKVTYNFNKIEVNNGDSLVTWSAVSILALTASSPGCFEVVDDATVTLNSCTFTNMGSFAFRGNSTITDSVFRGCNQIHQHGASFDTCTFDSTTASQAMVSANDLSSFDNSTFIYSRGHGIRIDTPGSYSLVNVIFTGFGASGTSAACVYNNSGGLVTINLTGGTLPTIRNGAGASTDTVVAVTLTLTGLPANTEVTIVRVSDRAVLHHTENAGGSEQFGYGSAYVGTVVDILCHNLDYDPTFGSILDYTLASENSSVPIQMVPDNIYYNP